MNKENCNERQAAAEILLKVFREGAYSSLALQQAFREHPQWEERSRKLITNLVYTVLTNDLRLEAMINLYSRIPLRRMKPYVAAVLMISTAQLLWMDKIPPSAVVNEAVKLILASPYKNLSGFVNAVLRSMLRNSLRESWPEAGEDLLAHLSVRYSLPRWILELWEETYGIETVKELARNLTAPRGLSIRCNTLKITPAELEKLLINRFGAEHVSRGRCCPEAFVLRSAGDAVSCPEFQQGLFTVQDESSMLCAYAVAPEPGERILDLCAAPGGKSSHLAQRMGNRGVVAARDLHPHKIRLMEQTAHRLGLTAMHPEQGDALVMKDQDREAWDRVLLDAPCSGLGILRTKPDLKLHRTEKNLEELGNLQKKLLRTAADCVKPGGTLVYSTCTINPGENEENVSWFLDNFPQFQARSLEKLLPGEFPRKQIHPQYTIIFPETHNFDGFFLARFDKTR